MLHKNFRLILTAFFLLAATLKGQDVQPFVLTADGLADGKPVALENAGWKFRFGDDAARAERKFDDGDWQKIQSTTLKPELLTGDWNGRGWFRLHLKVDENLANQTFALFGTQRGAAEVYLDGRRNRRIREDCRH